MRRILITTQFKRDTKRIKEIKTRKEEVIYFLFPRFGFFNLVVIYVRVSVNSL